MICENYRKSGSVRCESWPRSFGKPKQRSDPGLPYGFGYFDGGLSFNLEMATRLRNRWRSTDTAQGEEV